MNSLLDYAKVKVDGADVKRIRELLNISQDKLSKILDVSPISIYLWEKDKQQISPENQAKLLEIFDCINNHSQKEKE